ALPVDVGSYAVQANGTDANRGGSAAAVLGITPATVTVDIGNLAHTYDGNAKLATVHTTPAGVATCVADAQAASPGAAPTDAGDYDASVTIEDANYVLDGNASAVLSIAQATAQVTLSDLTQVYDGNPRQVQVATTPAGLDVEVLYNGAATLPVDVGNYAVVAT